MEVAQIQEQIGAAAVSIDPLVKCPHCGSDMEVVVVGKPAFYVTVCPKRIVIEHPSYIYTPTIEIK
jgi:hypothetical protein